MSDIIIHKNAAELYAKLEAALEKHNGNGFRAMVEVYGEDRPYRNFPQVCDTYHVRFGEAGCDMAHRKPWIAMVPADVNRFDVIEQDPKPEYSLKHLVGEFPYLRAYPAPEEYRDEDLVPPLPVVQFDKPCSPGTLRERILRSLTKFAFKTYPLPETIIKRITPELRRPEISPAEDIAEKKETN
jgi:hypothetical protein